MNKKATPSRDVEKNYPKSQFIDKLNRFAKALKSGTPFIIQVAKKTVYVPASAVISVEHEKSGPAEELEFQLKWTSAAKGNKKTATKKTSQTAAKAVKRSTVKSSAKSSTLRRKASPKKASPKRR